MELADAEISLRRCRCIVERLRLVSFMSAPPLLIRVDMILSSCLPLVLVTTLVFAMTDGSFCAGKTKVTVLGRCLNLRLARTGRSH